MWATGLKRTYIPARDHRKILSARQSEKLCTFPLSATTKQVESFAAGTGCVSAMENSISVIGASTDKLMLVIRILRNVVANF